MTPHNSANKNEIAKTVLMPGDPLRAKFVADTFLTDVKLVNEVRNMFMYTGKYNGKEITIAGSGMGQPSMGIYSYELFKFYDVENIIRIGSAGSYVKDLNLYDVVLATESYSDASAFNELVTGVKSHITKPSKELNDRIIEVAKSQNVKIISGRVHSSDVFYGIGSFEETKKLTNAICVEMESAALFANAKAMGKNAACLVTISDNLVTKERATSAERQSSFIEMMKIALELA